jgi:hypothetical protein
MLKLTKPDGSAIAQYQEWTPPKQKIHWKAGRSAMELARSCFRDNNDHPQPPDELLSLLHSSTRLKDLQFKTVLTAALGYSQYRMANRFDLFKTLVIEEVKCNYTSEYFKGVTWSFLDNGMVKEFTLRGDVAMHITSRYDNRGYGFIECHHNRPVSEMDGAGEVRLDDLSLLCSNCHRMIHRARPWITVGERVEGTN